MKKILIITIVLFLILSSCDNQMSSISTYFGEVNNNTFFMTLYPNEGSTINNGDLICIDVSYDIPDFDLVNNYYIGIFFIHCNDRNFVTYLGEREILIGKGTLYIENIFDSTNPESGGYQYPYKVSFVINRYGRTGGQDSILYASDYTYY